MDFSTFDAMSTEEKQYQNIVTQVALACVVPPCALAAIVRRESDWDANAHSADGGFGLCQITAGVNTLGDYVAEDRTYKLFDAKDNLLVAAKYFLKPAIDECLQLRTGQQTVMDSINPEILFFAFCAYNMGAGEVSKYILAGVNPDIYSTKTYGAGTLAIYHRYLAMAHAG